MKIITKNLCYLILVLLFTSCTISEFKIMKLNEKVNINSNHWVTYKQPESGEKLLTSIEAIPIAIKSTVNYLSTNINSDSVEIITKNGQKYIGTITKSDYSGYFIKINNNREIYLSNQEIKIITFLDNIKTENISIDSSKIIQNTKLEVQNEDDFYNNETSNNPTEETHQGIKKTEPMSLLSFIFGLLGFAPLPVIGGLGWIAALILSKAGRKKIDKNPEKYKGRGFAVAGQVLGLIGITLALLALAVVIIFLLLFF